MTLDFHQLLLLGLLSASIHWLVARSEIARPLWENARGWFDRLLRCAGCSGWWLGLGLGAAGVRPLTGTWRAVSILASGLLAVVLTPVIEGVLLWGLERSAVEEPEPVRPRVTDDFEDTTTPSERPPSTPRTS